MLEVITKEEIIGKKIVEKISSIKKIRCGDYIDIIPEKVNLKSNKIIKNSYAKFLAVTNKNLFYLFKNGFDSRIQLSFEKDGCAFMFDGESLSIKKDQEISLKKRESIICLCEFIEACKIYYNQQIKQDYI